MLLAGQFCTRGDPAQHALHAATACCMLQLLCLLVHMAADQQLDAATCRSTMTQCHERSKALRQAGGTVVTTHVIKNNMLFLSTKELLDDGNAMREALVPAIGAHWLVGSCAHQPAKLCVCDGHFITILCSFLVVHFLVHFLCVWWHAAHDGVKQSHD